MGYRTWAKIGLKPDVKKWAHQETPSGEDPPEGDSSQKATTVAEPLIYLPDVR